MLLDLIFKKWWAYMIYHKCNTKLTAITCFYFFCYAYRKQTIHQEKKFDFLKDLVANVPDHQAEDESDPNISDSKRQKTPR